MCFSSRASVWGRGRLMAVKVSRPLVQRLAIGWCDRRRSYSRGRSTVFHVKHDGLQCRMPLRLERSGSGVCASAGLG